MVLGLSAFYLYLSKQQYYYATMKIEYLNSKASEGMTPNGAKLNPEEMRAAVIVSSALEDIGLDINVDSVRNSLSIEGVLTEEEQNRKNALLNKGEEYELKPTNYQAKLSLNSKYSEEVVQSLLTAIVNRYMTWYGNQYVITRAKPGILDADLLDKYDYIIVLDMISKAIYNMLEYININGETFRSTQTGLSFYDLQTRLQWLRDVRLEDVYVKTINSGITKDPDLLTDYYSAVIAENTLLKEQKLVQVEEMEKLLKVYVSQMLGAQDFSNAANGTNDSSNYIILSNVYEIYDENHDPVYSKNNYEELMDRYASYMSSVYSYEQKIKDSEYILQRLATVSEASSEKSQQAIHDEISALIDQVNSIYSQVDIVGTEFNQSQVAKNIRITTSAKSAKGVNIALYMALAAVLFLGIGCTGAIVLGRAGDLMEYVLYTDKVTGLPSRISCDEQIEKISKLGALDSFCCVCLFVTNLGEINNRMGRDVGNQMLAELGLILQITAKQYGFIGYNNGNQFLCLLDNCVYEKAKDMLDFIGIELEKSQAAVKPSIVAKIGDSNKLSVYQINNLISSTFKQPDIVVYKPLNNDAKGGAK
jgi:GGDEF domain-containing protein